MLFKFLPRINLKFQPTTDHMQGKFYCRLCMRLHQPSEPNPVAHLPSEYQTATCGKW